MTETVYVVWQEPEGWVSKCMVTGITSCGDTKEEAVEMLKEALELYYQDEQEVESRSGFQFGNLALHA